MRQRTGIKFSEAWFGELEEFNYPNPHSPISVFVRRILSVLDERYSDDGGQASTKSLKALGYDLAWATNIHINDAPNRVLVDLLQVIHSDSRFCGRETNKSLPNCC